MFLCFSHKTHAGSATRPMVRSKGFTLMQMLKLFLDALLLQKNTGKDGRPLHVHVNEDDDEGECSTDREGGGESGGDSLSNRKASDGSGRLR